MMDMVVSNQPQNGTSFRIGMIAFVNTTFLVLNDILPSRYGNNILRSPNY